MGKILLDKDRSSLTYPLSKQYVSDVINTYGSDPSWGNLIIIGLAVPGVGLIIQIPTSAYVGFTTIEVYHPEGGWVTIPNLYAAKRSFGYYNIIGELPDSTFKNGENYLCRIKGLKSS